MNTLFHKCLLILFLFTGICVSFSQPSPGTFLFRISEDNDLFKVIGKSTDEAYTNGIRFDLFYVNKHRKRFSADRLVPATNISTHGWGLNQLMFTPRDLSKSVYQPNDYAYAGALVLSHSFYTYNPLKHHAILTELVGGMRGPMALAGQTQSLIHKITDGTRPMGWSTQLNNSVLFNLNVSVEKQILNLSPYADMLGGGQLMMGTMVRGGSLYTLIRIGKMTPYFNGYVHQYTSLYHPHWQAYAFIKPSMELMGSNALLYDHRDPQKLETLVYMVDYGVVVSYKHIGASFTQKSMSALVKGLYPHMVGNISLYVSW